MSTIRFFLFWLKRRFDALIVRWSRPKLPKGFIYSEFGVGTPEQIEYVRRTVTKTKLAVDKGKPLSLMTKGQRRLAELEEKFPSDLGEGR